MGKFKKIFAISFVITAIIFGIGFIFRYKYLVNQQSENFIDEQFTKKEIKGHLSSIVKYKQERVVLEIKNFDNQTLTYGTLCVDNNFFISVQEKDSVYKGVGEQYLNFINKNGKSFRLKVNFCDL